jgi:predicted metalloprotease with PDZ domain
VIRILFILLGALMTMAAAPVDVTVTVEGQGRISSLKVVQQFDGDSDGETLIQLPNEWAGETGLYELIRDVQIDGGDILPGQPTSQMRIAHAPGAPLQLSYRVLDGANGVAGARTDTDSPDFRPRVRRDFFLAVGATIFSEIAGRDDAGPARFRLAGLPTGMSFASDLEHPNLTYGALFSSVLIGGNIRLVDAGGGARLALVGDVVNKSDIQWRDNFRAIAAAQRDFWGTPAGPFLVTVMSLPRWRGENTALGGAGLGDAFAAFVGADASAADIEEVIGHEMMHSWIPGAIGGLARDGAQIGDFWLSEGFTDWASWRVMMRARLWTPQTFAAAFNARLGAYDSSRLRSAPNQAIIDGFWTNPLARDLAYQRGMLLAAHWDQRIRAQSDGARGLQHVLWRMRELARAQPQASAAALLPQAMRDVAGLSIENDIARHIDRGEPVQLAMDIYVPCGFVLRQDGVRQLRLGSTAYGADSEACRHHLAGG